MRNKSGKRSLMIGRSDFRTFIKDNGQYVDKTGLIEAMRDYRQTEGFRTFVIHRHRRSGKTLNLSTLRYFYSEEVGGRPTKELFNNLKIKRNKDCMEDQGQYPVIFMTLKDIKGRNFGYAKASLAFSLARLYSGFRTVLLESKHIDQKQKENINKIIQRSDDEELLKNALQILVESLHAHYQHKVVLLIDEYETPIQSANEYGFGEEMMDFMQAFFSVLKNEEGHLEYAVLTGILPMPQERLFAGIDNIEMVTALSKRFAPYYGFTETEVRDLMQAKFDFSPDEAFLKEIKSWYGGYHMGDVEIFNPWSIVKFIADNQNKTTAAACSYERYWSQTGSDKAICELLDTIKKANPDIIPTVRALLRGHMVTQEVDISPSVAKAKGHIKSVLSLLLFSGYLTANNLTETSSGSKCNFYLPNTEIFSLYAAQFVNAWKQECPQQQGSTSLTHQVPSLKELCFYSFWQRGVDATTLGENYQGSYQGSLGEAYTNFIG